MASGVVKLDERSKPEQVELIGFSAPEPEGIWTAGPRAAITFRIVPERHIDIDSECAYARAVLSLFGP